MSLLRLKKENTLQNTVHPSIHLIDPLLYKLFINWYLKSLLFKKVSSEGLVCSSKNIHER